LVSSIEKMLAGRQALPRLRRGSAVGYDKLKTLSIAFDSAAVHDSHGCQESELFPA